MQDYVYKTKPFAHQDSIFKETRDKESFAINGEQGTGKTKIIIDTTAWNYSRNRVRGLIVIAPNGVHRNWVNDEIPKHLPDYIPRICRFWDSDKAGTKKYQRHMDELFANGDELRILAVNIESVLNKNCFKLIEKFLFTFESIFVNDESHRIKDMKATCTKRILKFRQSAKMRRNASGTPGDKPEDFYPQYYFLDPDILGMSSYTQFKNRYIEMVQDPYEVLRREGIDTDPRKALAGLKRHEVEQVYLLRHIQKRSKFATLSAKDEKGKPVYRNLDELYALMAPHTSRILKKDCLDLPDKIYKTIYTKMGKKQETLYKSIRDELIAEFEDQELTTPLALTKILRLQQIVGGFFPTDDGDVLPIDDSNRIKTLKDILQDINGKVIIWARFVPEIKEILSVLPPDQTVSYFGGVDDDEKEQAKIKFNTDPNVKYFVGNQESGGTGLTLLGNQEIPKESLEAMIYYSNNFSYITRSQSEDRGHRIGLKNPIAYIDIIAPGTIDEKIISALLSKKDVAGKLNGDFLGLL